MGSKSSLDGIRKPEPLYAEPVDLPDALTLFDPLRLLCRKSCEALEHPDRILLPTAKVTKSLPRGRLATRSDLCKLAGRWDKI